MKKQLHKAFAPFALVLFFAIAIVLPSCKKDETCGLQINVVDSLNFKQRYMWVVIDIPENTPPSQNGALPSNTFPIKLNTQTSGTVSVEFDLPAIVQANIYDSIDYELLNPVKKKIIKLEPGETVTETIAVN